MKEIEKIQELFALDEKIDKLITKLKYYMSDLKQAEIDESFVDECLKIVQNSIHTNCEKDFSGGYLIDKEIVALRNAFTSKLNVLNRNSLKISQFLPELIQELEKTKASLNATKFSILSSMGENAIAFLTEKMLLIEEKAQNKEIDNNSQIKHVGKLKNYIAELKQIMVGFQSGEILQNNQSLTAFICLINGYYESLTEEKVDISSFELKEQPILLDSATYAHIDENIQKFNAVVSEVSDFVEQNKVEEVMQTSLMLKNQAKQIATNISTAVYEYTRIRTISPGALSTWNGPELVADCNAQIESLITEETKSKKIQENKNNALIRERIEKCTTMVKNDNSWRRKSSPLVVMANDETRSVKIDRMFKKFIELSDGGMEAEIGKDFSNVFSAQLKTIQRNSSNFEHLDLTHDTAFNEKLEQQIKSVNNFSVGITV